MTYATSTKELSRYLPELFPHKVTQPWEGTHTDLLALLEIPPYPRQRPWSARQLSIALTAALPALEASGWRFAYRKTSEARLLCITPPLGRVDG